jgi:hypothetical protein
VKAFRARLSRELRASWPQDRAMHSGIALRQILFIAVFVALFVGSAHAEQRTNGLDEACMPIYESPKTLKRDPPHARRHNNLLKTKGPSPLSGDGP